MIFQLFWAQETLGTSKSGKLSTTCTSMSGKFETSFTSKAGKYKMEAEHKSLFQSVTVDGWNPVNSQVEVGSFSHYLQGFIHPRWCYIAGFQSSTVQLLFSMSTSQLLKFPPGPCQPKKCLWSSMCSSSFATATVPMHRARMKHLK